MSERGYARSEEVYYGLDKVYQRSLEVGLLEADQELALAQRIEAGDLEAKNHLIESNLRLVMSIAGRRNFEGLSMEYDDRVQEGVFGLIRAAEKFDYRKGFRFSTYATIHIFKAISSSLRHDKKYTGLTREEYILAGQIDPAIAMLEQELGRTPSNAELADWLDYKEEVVAEIRQLAEKPLSIDHPISDESDATLTDKLADSPDKEPPAQVARNERNKKLIAVLGEVCTPIGAQVITLRFGLEDGQPKTQKEVADELKTTLSKVRSHEARSIGILRTRRDLREVA